MIYGTCPGGRPPARPRALGGRWAPGDADTGHSTGICPNGNASGKEVTVTASPAPGDADLHPVPPGDPGARIPKYYQVKRDRKSTRLNSSHVEISYAVFC